MALFIRVVFLSFSRSLVLFPSPVISFNEFNECIRSFSGPLCTLELARRHLVDKPAYISAADAACGEISIPRKNLSESEIGR